VFGKLVRWKMLKRNGRYTGRAFVEYYEVEHAKTALESMDEKLIGTRKLRV